MKQGKAFDGRIYFIGIGGIGTSGLALFFKQKGFFVLGSDCTESETTERLKESGIPVFIGSNEKNILKNDLVVYSSAIGEDNPELKYAREQNIALVNRARLLSLVSDCFEKKIGVGGSHGKTTVTSLLAHVFKAEKARFTSFIGGEDADFSNYVSLGGEYLIAEVCEYKRNIDLFSADMAVLLNVDDDHLDCYDGLEDLKNTFYSFLGRAKKRVFYENIKYDGDGISFGLSNSAKIQGRDVKEEKNGVSFLVVEDGKPLGRFSVRLKGERGVLNALAAIAAARANGISVASIKKGLSAFKGIKRRDELIGYINGAPVIADYAHHPTQLCEMLKEYKKEFKGKLFVVFQPHTYSRTAILFDAFKNALADERELFIFKTYAARESFLEKGSATALSEALPSSRYFEDAFSLKLALSKEVKEADKVLILGAGDLYFHFKKTLKKKDK